MKQSDKNGLALLAIIGIFVVAITTVVLTTEENEPVPTVAEQYQVKSPEAKAVFVESCMGDEGGFTYCSCVYDRLEKDYGAEGIVKMGLEYNKTGEIPEVMLKISADCI